MSDILDRFTQAESHFRPQTVSEFFALQLARKLGDTSRLHHYLNLVGQHSEPVICEAFESAKAKAEEPLAASFEIELGQISQKGGP
jgi:bacterioferritin (cytochrome b1)